MGSMLPEDYEAVLYQARAEWREEKKRALEAEEAARRLQKENELLKRQVTEYTDRLAVTQDLLKDCDRLRIVAEELIARSRRALKTGNSPERVLAALAAILLENHT
jgi:hypothetical protein